MTPKFYSFLWIVFAVSAGIIWLAGVFTLTTVVVYGFISFGLVFAGMMCVLPGVVSHPTVAKTKTKPVRPAQPQFKPASVPMGHAVRAKLRYQ